MKPYSNYHHFQVLIVMYGTQLMKRRESLNPESESERQESYGRGGHFIFLCLDPTTGLCSIFDAQSVDEQSKYESSFFDTGTIRMTVQLISDYINNSCKREWTPVRLHKIGLQRTQG